MKEKVKNWCVSTLAAFKKGAENAKDSVVYEKTASFISKKKKIASKYIEKGVKKAKDIRLPEQLPLTKEKCGEYGKEAKKCVISFWRRDPQIAAFVFTCLFCALSILCFDRFLAHFFLNSHLFTFFRVIAYLNPSAWWFLILGGLWLFDTIYAGYSETPENFALFTKKANDLLFVILALGISSAITICINIIVGRYDTEALNEGLYGFSLFSAGETFPSWGAQSIWAVCLAFGHLFPKYRQELIRTTVAVSVCLILSGGYFLSDVVLGSYIGIMSYHMTDWFFSDERENQKLITFDQSDETKNEK